MSDPYGAAIQGLGERLNRLSRRMVPGGLGGRSDLPSPRVALAGMVPQVDTGEPAAITGPHMAWFNAKNGDRVSGRAKWDEIYATTEHDWFEFIPDSPYDDQTYIELLEPGMLFANYRWSSTAGATDAAIWSDSFAILASHEAAEVGSCAGGMPVGDGAGATVPGEKLWVELSAVGSDIFGQLILMFWPDDPWVKSAATSWLWEDTGTF